MLALNLSLVSPNVICVDEKTRSQMFKLRQTWNEVFPAKKLYAVDVRVNSIDPAWPITAVPPTIHVNPKFFRQQQAVATPAAPSSATVASTPASTATTPSLPLPTAPAAATATTTTAAAATATAAAASTEDAPTLSEAKMREQLLKKKKELLELQQKKLELELLQTKARLEEQQKQLERQTGHLQAEQVQQLLLPALQGLGPEAAKLLATPKPVETPVISTKSHSTNSATVTVSEATVATSAAIAARGSGGASGSSKAKTEVVSSAAASVKTTVVMTTTSSSSRSTPASSVTSTASSVRSRDPRLASRQLQQNTLPVNNTVPSQDEEMQEPDSVFEPVKLETAKPKPQITINLGCANKGTVNKESRGISKKDPRLLSNKVQVTLSGWVGALVTIQTNGKEQRVLLGEKRRGHDRDRGRDRDRSSSSKYGMFAESDESPSPPPPPIISVDAKKREESSSAKSSAFKDVKASMKGRNYVRRNLPVKSRSPEIPPVTATGDVDLRLGAPPEKHPRLNMFQPDTNASIAPAEEDIKKSKAGHDPVFELKTEEVPQCEHPKIMFTKLEQRSWIKIEVARGRSAQECFQRLREACGDAALPYHTVARWVKAFREGLVGSAVKVMFIVAYDIDGVILHHAVPPRQTVNADYYCRFLQHHLRPALRRKRRHLGVQNPIILHDNAKSHTAAAVKDLLRRWQWEILEHPPYSLDMSPCNYDLFAKVKEPL
ncbi:hypothetical protein ANN_03700 [Periplaneta americana]|uniref:Pre-mRNA cleavage complex 2 protein Pcf11 helical domain-containing protein n=1 Tax=Periplaneta americana TaxID=6978 RepID=A0ABQ8U1R3_PERAM|nr:hypothetical protein ANN_03700 [Periplaneta americana]